VFIVLLVVDTIYHRVILSAVKPHKPKTHLQVRNTVRTTSVNSWSPESPPSLSSISPDVSLASLLHTTHHTDTNFHPSVQFSSVTEFMFHAAVL